jgi:hypothetical protein
MEGIKKAAQGILLNLNIDINKNDTRLDQPNSTIRKVVSESVGG